MYEDQYLLKDKKQNLTLQSNTFQYEICYYLNIIEKIGDVTADGNIYEIECILQLNGEKNCFVV